MNRFLPLALVACALAVTSACGQDERATAQNQPVAPVWIPFEDAVEAGKKSGKMVLVDVWSPRCGWCRKMQEEVYTREDLLSYVNEHFVTGRLNIDVRDDTLSYLGYELSSADLSVGFGARGTPTTVFLSPDGSYITRLPGFHDYDSYFPVLRFIGTESFREMTFQEFLDATGETQKSGDR